MFELCFTITTHQHPILDLEQSVYNSKFVIVLNIYFLNEVMTILIRLSIFVQCNPIELLPHRRIMWNAYQICHCNSRRTNTRALLTSALLLTFGFASMFILLKYREGQIISRIISRLIKEFVRDRRLNS